MTNDKNNLPDALERIFYLGKRTGEELAYEQQENRKKQDSLVKRGEKIAELNKTVARTEQHLRSAEAALQEKDKEIERLNAELNHLADAGKKVDPPAEEPAPDTDEWAGAGVPRVVNDGNGCALNCYFREYYPELDIYRCEIYDEEIGNRDNDRLPECIAEFGLNPGEVTK